METPSALTRIESTRASKNGQQCSGCSEWWKPYRNRPSSAGKQQPAQQQKRQRGGAETETEEGRDGPKKPKKREPRGATEKASKQTGTDKTDSKQTDDRPAPPPRTKTETVKGFHKDRISFWRYL